MTTSHRLLWDDEFINDDKDQCRFDLQLIKRSSRSPEVYVSFPFNWIENIKSQQISVYADYMDQVEMEDYDEIGDDGFGMAELYNGEGLWISKEDYERLQIE